MNKRKGGVLAKWIWFLSLLSGMLITTAVCQPKPGGAPVYAWWGTMYPQYCFCQEREDSGEDLPVKIDFQWLRIK